jgi:ankyrin repeat protein
MKAGMVGAILVLGLGFAGCATTAPLYDAARVGNLPTVKELLGQNPRLIADRDGFGGTALHVGAGFRQKDVAELLLAKGADVNARMESHGVTPLHIAAGLGYKDIAEVLLANGADVDARNKLGQTPLVVADCKGQNRRGCPSSRA